MVGVQADKRGGGVVLYMCSIIRRIRMQACNILGMYV